MFKLLKTFIAVYEQESFTKAADLLFLTQPTISGHIKKLEAELDTLLFIRTSNKAVYPCQAAQIFYPKAIELLANWEQEKRALQNEESYHQRLHLAASLTIGTEVLPKILAKIAQDYPQLQVTLTICNSDEVAALMENSQCDLGFVEKTIFSHHLKSRLLCQDRLIKIITAPDLNHWIIREQGSGLLFATQNYFETNRIVPEHILTVNNNDAIIHLLHLNMGNALLSERYIHRLTIPFTYLPDNYTRHFSLIHRPRQLEDPYYAKLIDQLTTYIQEDKPTP
ncbi:LysR family transcriptional regulator [Brochothrix thermosphacta]|uniref:LysR family transcriptional regulator n=1 Tax=Brochothrix thermosphacta TaxID=2756 RepID=UPI000EC8C49A|nr:LysR family transcriptional regulator [Brochothrix thermosphacta]HCZ40159.1 hypothetical protein [Brochothrix thermosphacta]HCZ45558.1 hypothetical protein [Brochothrix thermosphacta]